MNIYPFIILKSINKRKIPLRININRIDVYHKGTGRDGAYIAFNSTEDGYAEVQETSEEIDKLIDELNKPTIINQVVDKD